MAASSSSLPPSLKNYCQNPPWRASSSLFTRTSSPGLGYKKIDVLPSDPEFQFVSKYFEHQKPTNRSISRIYFIHQPRLNNLFENYIPTMEREAAKTHFQPRWKKEENQDLRQKAFQRFEQLSSPYTPFTIPWGDHSTEAFQLVPVLPLWHGSSKDKCDSICDSGFTFFGKHALMKGTGENQSMDEGYYGSGIYFTTSARYAADIYSDGENLLLGWVAMRKPYPVINDNPLSKKGYPQPCSDMEKLRGLGAYENYNSHYIPSAPANLEATSCAVYYPCPPSLEPFLDELVVFQASQTLCRFWIEMQVDLLKTIPAATPTTGNFLTFLFQLLDHPEIKNHLSLSTLLSSQTEALLELPEKTLLNANNLKMYKLAQRLVTTENKISPSVAAALEKILSSKPNMGNPSPTVPLTAPTKKKGFFQTLFAPSESSSVQATSSPAKSSKAKSSDAVSSSIATKNKTAPSIPAPSAHLIKKLHSGESRWPWASSPSYGFSALSADEFWALNFSGTLFKWNKNGGNQCAHKIDYAQRGDPSWCIGAPITTLFDGRVGIPGRSSTIELWDPNINRLDTMGGPSTAPIRALAAFRTRNYFLSGHSSGEVKLWNADAKKSDAASKKSEKVYKTKLSKIDCITISSDEKLFVCMADSTIQVLDLETEVTIRIMEEPDKIKNMLFSHDETLVYVVNETLKICNIKTNVSKSVNLNGTVVNIALALHPRRNLLACGYSKTLKFFDLSTGDCLSTIDGHYCERGGLAFLHDGSLVASCGQEDVALFETWKDK